MRRAPPDLVINFCDTGFGNVASQELHVPALLELLGVPYSGAAPACMVLCYDKQVVRLLAAALDIPVPAEVFLGPDPSPAALLDRYPALIKPNQADGSIGIRQDAVVRSGAEAKAYIAWARSALPGRALLVQEYARARIRHRADRQSRGRAYRAAGAGGRFFPAAGRLKPILAYESKVLPDSPYWTQIKFKRAEADPALLAGMADQARRLFARLGCRDYARFDFRCARDGQPKLLKVNPNPAWANDGKLAFMAGFAGIGYPDMLKMILDAARVRLGLG